jgi:hypothetical protein
MVPRFDLKLSSAEIFDYDFHARLLPTCLGHSMLNTRGKSVFNQLDVRQPADVIWVILVRLRV